MKWTASLNERNKFHYVHGELVEVWAVYVPRVGRKHVIDTLVNN